MNEELKKIYEQIKKGGFNIKEFITRSEGSQLFATVLNDLLIRAATPEIPDQVSQLFTPVRITQGQIISFPSIRGMSPDFIPELGEFKFVDEDFTSISVEARKFGMRLGYSREMIDDNQVGLINWRTNEIGRSHRQLRRREMIKALSFFSTGPTTTTGVIGIRDHGPRYPQGGYVNFLSATALPWENILGIALVRLKAQTITVADMTIEFPVTPDFIIANPHHEMSIKKVLNAGITVVGTGVGISVANQGNNVAGSNVFNGVIRTQIYDPAMPTGQALIGAAGRGTIVLERDPLEVDNIEDLAFDAQSVRTRERYIPAVVENRYICDIQLS